MRVVRLPKGTTGNLEWQRDRERLMAAAIETGIGTRPPQWWMYEAGRPDLALDSADDFYVHLREEGPAAEHARERLRYLSATGELRPSELAAIAAGDGPAFAWRWQVLAPGEPV